MKRFLLLMLLAGCGSESERQAGAGGDASPDAGLMNLEAEPNALTPAQLEEKAMGALRPVLKDPGSARFSNLRNGAGGAVCGHVDVKEEGRYAGAKPFLVTPEGVGLISPTAHIGFGEPGDIFPDFYIRWCASPEELQTLGPAITASPTENLQVPEVPPPTDGGVAPTLPRPPTLKEPAKAQPPAPKVEEDGFSKAVLRKGESKSDEQAKKQ